MSAVTPQVAASYTASTYALANDGTVLSFGDDSYGQLGTGRILNSSVPIQIAGLDHVRDIAAGQGSVFAIKEDGTVWAWGGNRNGTLADGTTLDRASPVQVPSLTGVRAISVGADSVLALKADGSVWVWGYDGYDPTSRQPVQVPGISNVIAISNREYHKVALKSDGTVWTWGFNESGQLGLGTQQPCSAPCNIALSQATSVPQEVPGLTGVVAINSGYGTETTFVVKTDGTIWGWGKNQSGQLGDNTTTTHSVPTKVTGISGATAISAGDSWNGAALAIRTDGTVLSWGSNFYGQLGNGTASFIQAGSIPSVISGLTGIVSVSAGDNLSVAVDSSGSVWTWGANFNGELGDGTYSARSVPKRIQGLSGVLLARASSSFVVAVKQDGTVWAWGTNRNGQLGTSVLNRNTPVTLSGISNVSAISASVDVLALRQDGTVWQWGTFGDLNGSSTPMQVIGLPNIRAIAAGWNFKLALSVDGTVLGWGDPRAGELGVGASGGVAQVPGLSGISAVAAGNLHSLFLQQDGTVLAMGANDAGELGATPDGSCTYMVFANTPQPCSNKPLQVPGLSDVIAIHASDSTSYAIKRDGSVWAWGSNVNGAVGRNPDGSCTYQQYAGIDQPLPCFKTPQRIPTLESVIALSNLLALKADGTVWSWGGGAVYPAASDNVGPRPVVGLTEIVAIGSSGNHGIAMRADGSLFTWGYNNDGQLGDGTFAVRRSPVLVVNPSVDGFLNLKTGTSVNVSPELKVPFFVSSSGGITATSASVSTAIKFGAADIGKSGSVFVTAMAPSGSLSATQKAMGKSKALYATTSATSAVCSYVPVQLTSSGWQPVTNGQLIPYASGVLGDQLAAQTILNGTDTTNLKGAQFCLGYGASATDMSTSGNIRMVATIPTDSGASCPAAPDCTLPAEFQRSSVDCLFNWAEQNFPQILTPAGTVSATKAPYYYRAYPSTNNYLLASSADNAIWLYGPASGGNPVSVGPINSFLGPTGCSQ